MSNHKLTLFKVFQQYSFILKRGGKNGQQKTIIRLSEYNVIII